MHYIALCCTVYCSVLQCITVCYNVVHCGALCCLLMLRKLQCGAVSFSILRYVAVCCSVLRCVAVWWGTWTRSSNCDWRSLFRTLSCTHTHALPWTFSSLLDVSHSSHSSTPPSLFVYFSVCMCVSRSLHVCVTACVCLCMCVSRSLSLPFHSPSPSTLNVVSFCSFLCLSVSLNFCFVMNLDLNDTIYCNNV